MKTDKIAHESCIETKNDAVTNADIIISDIRATVMVAAYETNDNTTQALYNAAVAEELNQRLTDPVDDDRDFRGKIENDPYVEGADGLLTAVVGGMRGKADVLADTEEERRTLLDAAAEIETRIRGDAD